MTKRRDAGDAKNILSVADDHLALILEASARIETLTSMRNAEIARIDEQYAEKIASLRQVFHLEENALFHLMKTHRALVFSNGDIVPLAHGALLRKMGDRVTIPRTALEKCKKLGFGDVVKVAESLDRAAVEKWPDEKLFLIGAERKPREDFEYEIKR